MYFIIMRTSSSVREGVREEEESETRERGTRVVSVGGLRERWRSREQSYANDQVGEK
jgi:hypothetical protein